MIAHRSPCSNANAPSTIFASGSEQHQTKDRLSLLVCSAGSSSSSSSNAPGETLESEHRVLVSHEGMLDNVAAASNVFGRPRSVSGVEDDEFEGEGRLLVGV